MTFVRASMIGGVALSLAMVAGCQKEEPMQAPPPPAPAAADDAGKATPPERGSSKIEAGSGSESGKDTTTSR